MTRAVNFTRLETAGALLERPGSRRKPDPALLPERKPRPSPQQPSSDDGNRYFVNWPNVIWLTLVHLGCLAAPFFFSWEAVVLTLALHWLTGGIGICLGFHRHLTHLSFTTYKPVRWLLAFIGGLAGEGAVIDWVANHRKHHAHSDQEGDPHSPHDGPWWSHIFWLGVWRGPAAHAEHINRWVPDLVKDPVLRWIGYLFLPMHFAFAGVLMAAGYFYGG